ncbi:MAG: polymer-forming cytoskeletal protein [Flavobacteriaceae bacterium]|jgi:cytoskeletal protein CcmA (bactofilin family)|nr:polymer-forming cytoskeletal protein [Flavobacteriaceae bacterium]
MFAEKKQITVEPERNVMGKATEIKGNIISNGDFRIDGKVEGNITTAGKLILGKEGIIKGNVNCGNADFEGKFTGKLYCTGTLSLKSTAEIEGEVYLEKLSIEPGAVFNAICSMKGVKSLKTSDDTTQSESQKAIS